MIQFTLLFVTLTFLAINGVTSQVNDDGPTAPLKNNGGVAETATVQQQEEGQALDNEVAANDQVENTAETEDNHQADLIDELTANTAAAEDEEGNDDDDINNDDDVKAAYSLRHFIRFRPHILRRYVNSLVMQRIQYEPVTKMLQVAINGHRTVILSHINGYTFRVRQIAAINIRNYNSHVGNHLLAYRPTYHDYHASRLAAIFVNIGRIFPCVRRIRHHQGPICRMFSNEEDGFNQGQVLIQAGDKGNNLKVFGSHYSTYAFGFTKCPTLNPHCLPTHYQSTIVCKLPRGYCS